MWFFDNYIIPLAQKLKESGVFGVSCDEVLDYALDNRLEWEQKGNRIVADWLKEEKELEAANSSHESQTGSELMSSSSTASSPAGVIAA